MVDKDDKDNFEDNKSDLGPSDDGSSISGSSGRGDDDLPDDVPAVSMAKKKNAALFVGLFIGTMFILYSVMGGEDPKKANERGPKTEIQEMAGKEGAPVPKSGVIAGGGNEPMNVSAGAALPGATKEGVPELPFSSDKKDPQLALQQTLPPPPTLPPVFDPASIYVKNSDDQLGAVPSYSPGPSAFGERYTKKRSRLPEIEGGIETEDFEGLDPEARKAMEVERNKKINASMFVGGAKGGNAAANNNRNGRGRGAGIGSSRNRDALDFELAETGADKTIVTIRKDLERVILQGKVMDAVLETAINTDLPGKLRAIVSRDVYSESGKRVVIPKGSRLIGSYATDIKFGQARVYVIWNRVIRPDGIDAIFDSSDDLVAVDALGRTGVYGALDNRFFEIFGSSILLSSLTVAFAVAADAAAGGDDTTTTTTPSGTGAGTTTTSGNIVSQGVSKAVTDLGNDVSQVSNQYFKTTPRITVDQGTRIKIFVNKDVIFPPSFFGIANNSGGTEFLN